MQRHLVLITFAVLGILAAILLWHRIHHPLRPMTIEEIRAPLFRQENASGLWAVDGGVGAVGRPMPKKPSKGQKTKCSEDEVLINGGCWMEVVRKPGADECGTKAYLHEGRCYIPVVPAPPFPSSVEP